MMYLPATILFLIAHTNATPVEMANILKAIKNTLEKQLVAKHFRLQLFIASTTSLPNC